KQSTTFDVCFMLQTRRALLHLQHSCASPFGPAMLVPFRSSGASARCDATLPIGELAAEGGFQSAIMHFRTARAGTLPLCRSCACTRRRARRQSCRPPAMRVAERTLEGRTPWLSNEFCSPCQAPSSTAVRSIWLYLRPRPWRLISRPCSSSSTSHLPHRSTERE